MIHQTVNSFGDPAWRCDHCFTQFNRPDDAAYHDRRQHRQPEPVPSVDTDTMVDDLRSLLTELTDD